LLIEELSTSEIGRTGQVEEPSNERKRNMIQLRDKIQAHTNKVNNIRALQVSPGSSVAVQSELMSMKYKDNALIPKNLNPDQQK